MSNNKNPSEPSISCILSVREQFLLKKLIESYLEDGQPVASKLLADCQEISLSSASIRNVLASLERHGLLFAPHTSAGRLPTLQGLRLFLNDLLTITPVAESDILAVHEKLQGDSVECLISNASEILSGMTHLVGFASLPNRPHPKTISAVELIPLKPGKAVLLIVLNDTETKSRVIDFSNLFIPSLLVKAEQYLNHFIGFELGAAYESILSLPRSIDDNTQKIISTVALALKDFICEYRLQETTNLVMRGQNNLFSFDDTYDLNKIRQIFAVFEEQEALLGLLKLALQAEGASILLGEEADLAGIDTCSFITSPYFQDGQMMGMLGVIGPQRVPYQRVVALVETTAKILTTTLNNKT